MAIVPRITAVSYLDTLPFVYGAEHEGNFRAELALSDFSTAISDLREGRADIALVPVHAVPSLAGARIVTGYCVGFSGRATVDFLLANEPESPASALFAGAQAPLAPLLEAKKPCAYAVWAAHADTDPDWIEGLQHALTFGLEHTYEAILACGYGEKPCDVYGHLSRIDYIFDNQKEKALKKFWNSGLKADLRANPG
ncbi:MAG: ABC transporter substrate-binding protein [Alistipes sp.]|nr:ABC transporter substrate-binding protein [Alistipes sp.]MDE6623696.1 ABC transporter substrate-binding protein [Alistipes sp.]